MKKNEYGFTLIELLAMLVVLGIIMAITVPNITGILGQQKANMLVEDCEKMVNFAKVKISTNEEIKNPTQNACLVFTLNSLDTNDDFKEGPSGGKYNLNDSFVIVARKNNEYKYYVRLVEEVDGKRLGIELVEISDLLSNSKDYIKEKINSDTGIESMTTKEEVNSISLISNKCSNGVQAFYK